jgi:hypothetical protein
MSKDQITKPAVTTAVVAAAASTTRAMQNRISFPSHAGPLTEISLQAFDEAHLSRTFRPCDDDTEVGSLLFRTGVSIKLMSRGSSVSM